MILDGRDQGRRCFHWRRRHWNRQRQRPPTRPRGQRRCAREAKAGWHEGTRPGTTVDDERGPWSERGRNTEQNGGFSLKSHLPCGPTSERVVREGKEDDLVHDCWGGWTVFGEQRIPFDAPESSLSV